MPPTSIKISARKSDLARLQAYRVGQALKDAGCGQISYEFSTSLGDQNANDPLWQMPEKGVFTADLTKALIAGTTDMVVHSWKDLPTEERAETVIAATLPRADARDVLLVKKSVIAGWLKNTSVPPFKVLSSSPRRAHHLQTFLPWALPLQFSHVVFENVRGNIQTRVQKLLDGDAHALVVAKAALDRLLTAEEEEFQETRGMLRKAMILCRPIVIPLSECPGAAAQGALAIEVRRDRKDLIEFLAQMNSVSTFKDVTEERATLKSYGGGCHQKIGVTYLSRPYGQVRFLKGVTDSGEGLDRIELVPAPAITRAPKEHIFPFEMSDAKFYTRENLAADLTSLLATPHFVWVSRDEALPESKSLHEETVLWAAGLKTWRKLVERGYWVSGCAESLGEQEIESLNMAVFGEAPLPKVKLAHSDAPASGMKLIPTYSLHDSVVMPDLSEKTHFFWASSSAFERALRRYPEIAVADHACGPGHTYTRLREILGSTGRIHLFLSHKEWRDAVLLTE